MKLVAYIINLKNLIFKQSMVLCPPKTGMGIKNGFCGIRVSSQKEIYNSFCV